MKAILIIVIVVLLLAAVGWVRVWTRGNEAGIQVETEKIHQDTQTIMQEGKEVLNDAGSAIDRAIQTDRERQQPVPAAP